MNDEAAFLRAIHAAPGDDAPRLVYADWLAERGDPRGEFLREEVRAAAEFQSGKPGAAKKLRKASRKVGLEWALAVARPPVGVCTTVQFTNPGKPVTPADLDAGARRARIKLPADYRAFLLLHNGGEPRPNQFERAGGDDDDIETVEELSPFKPREGFTNVAQNFGGAEDDEYGDDGDAEGADHLLVIGMPGMDEDCLALSVGADDFGAVYYQAYIEGLQDPERLADSFAEFLAMIKDYRPDWVRFAEDGDATGMAAWLDAGGDPWVEDPRNDFTPLDYAIAFKRVGVAKAILDRRPKVTKRRAGRIREMAGQYPNREIRKLIEDYLKGQ